MLSDIVNAGMLVCCLCVASMHLDAKCGCKGIDDSLFILLDMGSESGIVSVWNTRDR